MKCNNMIGSKMSETATMRNKGGLYPEVFMRQTATEAELPSAKPAGARQNSDGTNKRALGNACGFNTDLI